MNKLRFLSELSTETILELEKLLKKPQINDREKKRINSVLLSNQMYTIDEISEVMGVHRDTISIWLNNWEKDGVFGLLDAPRTYRKPTLNEEEQEILRKLIVNSRSSKEVAEKLQQETGKKLSFDTIRRWAKRLGLTWKRARKSLKSKRCDDEFERAQEDIKAFTELEEACKLAIYYFDATGFNLTPNIPYAWQPIGRDGTLELPSTKSSSINVLGFLSKKEEELVPFVTEGSVNAAFVKACIDSFCSEKQSDKPIIIILDNASVHTAQLILDSIDEWHAQNVFLYFLPPYSPELNSIEMLWKKMKYSWLSFDSYESMKKLKDSVEQILIEYGTKYKINFA